MFFLLLAFLGLLLLPEPAFTANEEMKNFCLKLQKNESTLLAMGPLGNYLYLFDTNFVGLKLPLTALFNTTLGLSTSTNMINPGLEKYLEKHREKFIQPEKSTGFLFLASPPGSSGKQSIDSGGKPSIAIISSDKKWITLQAIHGIAGEGRIAHGGYGFTRTNSGGNGLPKGVFFTVNTTDQRIAATYDSNSGQLTITTVGKLLHEGVDDSLTPNMVTGTVALVPGADVDGGFYSKEDGLSYGFSTKSASIIVFNSNSKSLTKVPYKDFFQCTGNDDAEEAGNSHFGLLVGGVAGGALLLFFIVVAVCVCKANKFAKKSLKTRQTKSIAPTLAGTNGTLTTANGGGGGKKLTTENKVKATPSLENMTTLGKKSSKVGGGLSKLKHSGSALSTSSRNSTSSSKSSKTSTLSAVYSKNALSKLSAFSSVAKGGGGSSVTSSAPFFSSTASQASQASAFSAAGGPSSAISKTASSAVAGGASKAASSSASSSSSSSVSSKTSSNVASSAAAGSKPASKSKV